MKTIIMHKIILFILLTGIITTIGCVDSSGGQELSSSQLEGRWSVTEAQRDGELTSTMDNGVFEFGMNKQFTTNIPGYQKLGVYTLNDRTISFSKENFNDLVITEIDTNTWLMNVETKISDFNFSFKLEKIR